MNLRRVLLWIMLGALGFTALVGLLAVLTPFVPHVSSAIGTGIVTALAVGLLFSLSAHLEKPQARRSVLAFSGWIIPAYLCSLAWIWSDLLLAFGSSPWRIGEFFGLSLLYWALCGLPAVSCLASTVHARTKIAGWTGAILATLIFLLLWPTAWSEAFTHESLNFLVALALGLAGCGASAVACLVDIDRRPYRWLRWAGVLCAALTFLLLCPIAYSGSVPDFSPPVSPTIFHRWFAALISVAAVLGLSNILFTARLVDWQIFVRWIAIAAAIGCACMINLLSVWEVRPQEPFGRLAAASGIVAVCCTMAVAILARLNRKMDFANNTTIVSKVMTHISLTCPRCDAKQTIQLGNDTCTACGLLFALKIEEPRCPTCGYLLYLLTSPQCPECGTPVPEKPVARSQKPEVLVQPQT
ncbi:MAG: zinc ribbon domain-containing protein [Phycisphaerales bacterium]|nr:zinc ribbon domain-containing protein [Phycisphaerales bacterium]